MGRGNPQGWAPKKRKKSSPERDSGPGEGGEYLKYARKTAESPKKEGKKAHKTEKKGVSGRRGGPQV